MLYCSQTSTNKISTNKKSANRKSSRKSLKKVHGLSLLVIGQLIWGLFIAPSVAQTLEPSDKLNNTSIKIALAVDYNRDGTIEFAKSDTPFKPTFDEVSAISPYVFWLNDDDDKHTSETEGNDVPGTRSPSRTTSRGGFKLGQYNYESPGIDGSRDLIDFFPIAINLYDLFTLIPNTQGYRFKLTQEDEALNIVYTHMKVDNVNYYLKEVNVSDLTPLFGDKQSHTRLDAIETTQVTNKGITLEDDFIEFIKKNNNQGILLAEARAVSDKPLILEVENAEGFVVLTTQLPLKLVNIEDMYVQMNIRGVVVKDGETPTPPTENAQTLIDRQQQIINNKTIPQSFKTDKHFVFLHGYKVNEGGARAWHAEMFKRLYQSGSNAMYVGFSWDSNEGNFNGLFNYWGNVENALNTAPIVSDILNKGLSGDITLAAHSLGNMVLGQAIQQYGLKYNRYFMLNPAVPTEAYNGTQLAEAGAQTQRNLMIIPDWHKYLNTANTDNPRRLFASDWFRLFSGEDNRQQLKWRDLFSSVATNGLYNFYSKGDEVLAHSIGQESNGWDTATSGGQNAWITQEHQKGKNTIAAAYVNEEGGWGFNCIEPDKWWRPNIFCHRYDGMTPKKAFLLNKEQLRLRPFFTPFLDDNLFSEDVTVASKAAKIYKDHLLGYGIPALSHATGSTPLNILLEDNNTDMNTERFKTGWPAERGPKDKDKYWKHSDAKDVAYRYVHKLYDTWVEKGNLK